MAEDQVFSSSIKYTGIFNFRSFYEFCFKWLEGEMNLGILEDEYEEKLKGNSKDILIKWSCNQEVSEYFYFKVKIEFKIDGLSEVEMIKDGVKIKTNQGKLKLKIKGILEKDPKGQFETSSVMKIWRGIYEKFIIPSRIKQYEDKLTNGCAEFLAQSKAFLSLEGQK